VVREKQRQVGGDYEVSGGLALFKDIKPVRARVFLLLESQVPKFHRVPFWSGQHAPGADWRLSYPAT
jgi:hypothetical protein